MIKFVHARLEQNCKKPGPFRRDEWILRVRELSGRVPRGLYAIWDPFFGCYAQKCQGFSDILDFRTSRPAHPRVKKGDATVHSSSIGLVRKIPPVADYYNRVNQDPCPIGTIE